MSLLEAEGLHFEIKPTPREAYGPTHAYYDQRALQRKRGMISGLINPSSKRQQHGREEGAQGAALRRYCLATTQNNSHIQPTQLLCRKTRRTLIFQRNVTIRVPCKQSHFSGVIKANRNRWRMVIRVCVPNPQYNLRELITLALYMAPTDMIIQRLLVGMSLTCVFVHGLA